MRENGGSASSVALRRRHGMPDVRLIRLGIDGMTCASCAADIERLLMDVSGILDASVDYARETVDISFDADVIGDNDVYAAVMKLGYPVARVDQG